MTPGYPLRCAVVAICVLSAGRLGAHAPVSVPLVSSLAALPTRLGEWRGADEPPFDREVEKVLAADAYLNRTYWQVDGTAANVYVAYYGNQQAGDSIHSPQHCLPGNGWQPLSHSRLRLDGANPQTEINRYVVARHDVREVVYYWFEGRGRIVASEYLNKWFLVVDGMTRRRSEGALVRLVTPLPDGGTNAERAADAVLLAFGRQVHAELMRVLP